MRNNVDAVLGGQECNACATVCRPRKHQRDAEMPKGKGDGDRDDGSGRRRTGRSCEISKPNACSRVEKDIELVGSSGYIGLTLYLGTGVQYSPAQ